MARPSKYKDGWPSVTEICGIVNGFNPEYWYKGRRKQMIAQGLDLNKVDPIESCERDKRESQDIGHRVHEAVEAYLKDGNIPHAVEMLKDEHEATMFNAFVEVLQGLDIMGKGQSEVTFNCTKHEYGGTLDFLVGDTIYDWKTDSVPKSKQQEHERLYKYKLQVALYAIGVEEELKQSVSKGIVIRVSKDDPPAVKAYSFKITPKLKKQALTIRQIYKDIKQK
jgi:hypothetical protein